MNENYKQFVDKLNAYIRKFYLYQLIRGLILFILIALLHYSLISGLEYFNYFDPKIKLFILIITVLLILFIFLYFLIKPLIKLTGIGKRLNYYEVSTLLSQSYPEIKDKLINIIELADESTPIYSGDLKKASIDQKINELKIFRFSDAIRFKDLKVIVTVFLSVIFLFAISYFKSPLFFTESSVRLVRFHQKFIKPAPFTFEFENTDLEIVTGESIELRLRCEGKKIPEMMYVNISGNNFLMGREGDVFKYTIENVNSSIWIYFTDMQYVSVTYKIAVLNKPFISSFSVEIKPPLYTNLSNETLCNVGNLKIASGTTVRWIFNTVDTDSVFLLFGDGIRISCTKSENAFELVKNIYNNTEYSIAVKNSKLSDENNLVYKIQTVSDLFPEIRVVQVRDSVDFKGFHFKGNIIDDYGFHQLAFNITIGGKDSIIQIPFIPFLLNQDFYYSFNFEQIKKFGKSFEYYFSVSDNDFVNHFKRSVSETFVFEFPDYQDIVLKENSDQSSIERLFEKSSELTEEIQKEFKNFRMKQISSELSEWDKFQFVKDMMSKKAELENVLNQINKQNKDANNFLNSFSAEKGEWLKKQEQIEQLLSEVFSDELKKLFAEFNELAKQFDSRLFEQLSKEMDLSLEDLTRQLDKNMELLKKMKVEQRVERVIQELKNLSESERKTVEKLNKRLDLIQAEQIERENQSLINNLQEDYKETLEFNQTLDKPMNLFNFDKDFSILKENYSKTLNEIQKGNKRKAVSGIEEHVKGIEELGLAMNQMLKNNKKKQNQENIDNLKQILDNLILLSFGQEKLLKNFVSVDYNNPLVNELKLRQKNIQNQVVFIKDSLYAISKRSPEIGSVINKEVLALESNISSSFNSLESGSIGGARMYQQYGITAANNLALFLSEALESIKDQQNRDQEGDSDQEEPGGKKSKAGIKNLKDSQNSIREQLQKMIEQMKKGDKEQLSKSIGQTLAQQEIMQQLIREMISGGSVGLKGSEQLKAIDQLLEQSRRELINKNISNELISRQNLILSKLLDAEKAEIERDFEDKRESNTAIDIEERNPEGYFEYKQRLKNEDETIRKESYKLRIFYDQKYKSFINQIKE